MPAVFTRAALLQNLVIPLLVVLVFVLDLVTPLGYVVWILYLAPVGLCLYVDRHEIPPVVAAVCTILLAAAYFITLGRNELPLPVIIVNRTVGAVALWLLAGACMVYVRSRTGMETLLWLQRGQADLATRMREQPDAQSVAQAMLGSLAATLDAKVGVLYRLEDGVLHRLSAWALPDLAAAPATLQTGEALPGQAVRERRVMTLDGRPEHFLRAGSALASAVPSRIVAAPLSADGHLVGVIELGFVGDGAVPLDRAADLLDRSAEIMGMALRGALYRTRLEALLEETQRQAEELQVQQEELRVSNEELEERGRALMASQAQLEGQHAELEQTNSQLEEYTQSLERQRRALLLAQQELEAGKAELEQANRYKSEFLANMSHELRTPLNSSLILAKLLEDNRTGNLSPEEVRYAATIHASNTDLLNLINDILDLSRIEAGRLPVDPERIPLAGLCDDLQAVFTPIAQQKGLRFVVDRAPGSPDAIVTDNQRLQQILRNLLSNAFKFTERGEVRLGVAAAGPDRVSLSVRDTGIGIAADKQAIIFEAFQQADGTTSRRYGGTGLGLSISRELARLLGGTLEVSSTLGEGSNFTLQIPVTMPQADSGGAAREADAIATPARGGAAPAPALAVPAPLASSVAASVVVDAPADSPASAPVAPRQASHATPSYAPAPLDDDRARRKQGHRVILVVEDDLAFARVLYDLAHEMDLDCIHATTAESGLALAREHQPCGILLDVSLPDHSGLTLLDWLKHDPATRHIPAHMVSVADHAETALHLGAIGYTLKPSAREALADAIRRLESRTMQAMRRILVVEDDLKLRESIRALLGSLDVEIVTADSIAQALEHLQGEAFDCVIMDLALPDGSGYDLLEHMGGDASYTMPPVIVYTGRQLSVDDEQRLRRYSKSIIIKGARSPERLLDEVTLFLHSVEARLPPEHQRMLRAARQRDNAFEGRTILLAEDDARNIFALSRVLEPLGAELQIARNGREAIERLDGADLVLMDVMMPEMDGLTAMRHIRAMPGKGHLPIIALTAKAMLADREACLAAGANDYISKPIDVDKLVSLCRVWLQAK